MRKLFIILMITVTSTQLWSQNENASTKVKANEERVFQIPLIGEKAPEFKAESTNGIINFPTDFGKNWKILFSHPQDFTPVCSSEILELANLQSKFEELGVSLIVMSVDDAETHTQWKKSLEAINFKDRNKTKINFPLVADDKLIISKKYGMLHYSTNTTKSVRGVFIVDPNNIIQSISFYPMSIGRSTDEILRLISALQQTTAEKVMTPANWKKGDDLLVPPLPQAERDNPSLTTEGIYSLEWYMWYRKDK